MSSVKPFLASHKPLVLIIASITIIAVLLILLSTTNTDEDGVEGDSSKAYDASIIADEREISETDAFKITNYLPIISESPSYKISYLLETDEKGKYGLSLTLSALSASARSAMVSRLLTESFGKYDPLDYPIRILNYYNPFSEYSLDDLKTNNLPTNIVNSNLYTFEDSPYSVRTLTHTLYDGSMLSPFICKCKLLLLFL